MDKREAASDDERESVQDVEEEEFTDAESTDEDEAVVPRGAASDDEVEEGVVAADSNGIEVEGAEEEAEEDYDEVDVEEDVEDEEEEGQGEEVPPPAPPPQRKKLQPFEVPTSGAFWLHDDRFEESMVTEEDMRDRDEVPQRRKKLWDPSSEERWGHDKFEALERGDDIPDDEDTLAAFGRMGLRRGRGRGRGRGEAGRGRGRGRGRFAPANGSLHPYPQLDPREGAFGGDEGEEEEGPPPGFEEQGSSAAPRPGRGRAQVRGRGGRGAGRRAPQLYGQPPAGAEERYAAFDGYQEEYSSRAGRGRGGGRGGRGAGVAGSSYQPIPLPASGRGRGRGGRGPSSQQTQQAQRGAAGAEQGYEAEYPSLPSNAHAPRPQQAQRQQPAGKKLNVAARDFQPVPSASKGAQQGQRAQQQQQQQQQEQQEQQQQGAHVQGAPTDAPAGAAAPQAYARPAASQPPLQSQQLVVASAELDPQQSAMALQQIASGGAPSFMHLAAPPAQPQPQLQYAQGYIQPMASVAPMQFATMAPGQMGQMYVAVPYGHPTALPMSAPPTYMPAPQLAPQMASAPNAPPAMPAAPIAPAPVKRPLTITPPPDQAGASGEGAGGAAGEALPQRAGRGGGRRYSAKTGGALGGA